ncbi:MAG: hypothetical protein ACC642_05295 [Pseudomonadales bacterium]
MQHKIRTTLIPLFLATLLWGCGNEDATPARQNPDISQTPVAAAVTPPAPSSKSEPGPAFCGTVRPPVIEAAFEFGLRLAEVDFASDLECRYNLDVPGTQLAMLIYRIEPIAMYEMYSESSQKTADIPNLGEEAILLGNAHVEVNLDNERALEVSLKIDNRGGGFTMTPEKVKENLIRFAGMLAIRL